MKQRLRQAGWYLASFVLPFLLAVGVFGILHDSDAARESRAQLGVDYDPRTGLARLSDAWDYGALRSIPYGLAGFGIAAIVGLIESKNGKKRDNN